MSIAPSGHINLPPSVVFGYISDPSKHHEWNGLPKLTPVTQSALQVGSTFQAKGIKADSVPRFKGWHGGYGGSSRIVRYSSINVEIIELNPGKNVTFRYVPPDVKWAFEIHEIKNGSILRLRRFGTKRSWFMPNIMSLSPFSPERRFLARIGVAVTNIM